MTMQVFSLASAGRNAHVRQARRICLCDDPYSAWFSLCMTLLAGTDQKVQVRWLYTWAATMKWSLTSIQATH